MAVYFYLKCIKVSATPVWVEFKAGPVRFSILPISRGQGGILHGEGEHGAASVLGIAQLC